MTSCTSQQVLRMVSEKAEENVLRSFSAHDNGDDGGEDDYDTNHSQSKASSQASKALTERTINTCHTSKPDARPCEHY